MSADKAPDALVQVQSSRTYGGMLKAAFLGSLVTLLFFGIFGLAAYIIGFVCEVANDNEARRIRLFLALLFIGAVLGPHLWEGPDHLKHLGGAVAAASLSAGFIWTYLHEPDPR